MYWVIHLTETDEDVVLWPCKTLPDVHIYVKVEKLHSMDYAVIKGLKIKDFGKYVFNK
jgi:hypothetical protein